MQGPFRFGHLQGERGVKPEPLVQVQKDHLLQTQGGRGGSFPDAHCERIGMERQALALLAAVAHPRGEFLGGEAAALAQLAEADPPRLTGDRRAGHGTDGLQAFPTGMAQVGLHRSGRFHSTPLGR